MDALAASFPGSAVSQDASLEREFERRLADCPTLAYRVALGVLRNSAAVSYTHLDVYKRQRPRQSVKWARDRMKR